jgi:hypothetical protein
MGQEERDSNLQPGQQRQVLIDLINRVPALQYIVNYLKLHPDVNPTGPLEDTAAAMNGGSDPESAWNPQIRPSEVAGAVYGQKGDVRLPPEVGHAALRAALKRSK